MATKTMFTFTGVIHVINKSGDGCVRCREVIAFEQVSSPKGTYQFRPTQRTVFMPQEEQRACDEKMMKHAGEILSSALADQVETGQREQ